MSNAQPNTVMATDEYVNPPQGFPFKNYKELQKAEFMRGKQFFYRSPYGKSDTVFTVKFINVSAKIIRDVLTHRATIIFTTVMVISDLGNSYPWDRVQFI